MRFRHSQLNFPGSIHFVTTVTREHHTRFTEDDICKEVLEIFEFYRAKFKLRCYGYVLMPEHLHAVLYQLNDDSPVPSLMENFKRLTARKMLPAGKQNRNLWAEHFDDVPVPGTDALKTKLKYIHHNPVRRGLVENAEDYPWSSARDLLEQGSGIVTLSRDY